MSSFLNVICVLKAYYGLLERW